MCLLTVGIVVALVVTNSGGGSRFKIRKQYATVEHLQ